MYTKISPTRYMLIFEESAIKEITEGKFKILDTIRDIKLEGKSATVSIGIGRGKDSIRESDSVVLTCPLLNSSFNCQKNFTFSFTI